MPPVVALVEHDAEYAAAVEAGGGTLGPLADADAVVVTRWAGGRVPEPLPATVRWVGELPEGPVYTSATGAFGLPVAEHALTLMLAAARHLPECVRATEWT